MASERAKWTSEQERILLETYLEMRNTPAYKSDKGIKTKGWTALVTQLNVKFSAKLDRSQYKSKVDRTMKDYDVVKCASGLSGQGIDPATKKVTMDDDVWQKLFEGKPEKVVSKLKSFRAEGFEHFTICSLIAGDARATGEHAADLSALVATIGSTNPPAPEEGNDDTATEQGTAPPPNLPALPKKAPSVAPPSDSERKDKVKRIRGGAVGAKRQQKRARTETDEMMMVVRDYFALKLAQAQRKEKKKTDRPAVVTRNDDDSDSDPDDSEAKEREAYHDNDMGIAVSP